MRTGQTRLVLTTALAVAVWACASVSTSHAAQSLAIGEHAAMPGGAVQVPVTLADAAGVAAVSFIVNFDPDLLALTNVTTGELGAVFALEYKLEEGRVIVALVRDDALTAGAGTLANLHFTVNAGAVAGMSAPLAIADGTASGQHAVNLSWSEAASHTNGIVYVVSPASILGATSGGGTTCAGGPATVTVTLNGGMPPYTVTLDNNGGTQSGNGPVFNFIVTPSTTTTYHVSSGHDANNWPVTGSGSANVTVNPLPVAGPDVMGTVQNIVANAPVFKLLANDSSPVAGPLSINAVSSPSTLGGTVALAGGGTLLAYTPANNFVGVDQFSYTLSDSHCSAQGTVTVIVTSANAPSLNQISVTANPGAIFLEFAGIPGSTFRIQSAPTVDGPWSDLSGVLTADTTGLITYNDVSPPPTRFYRTRVAP